MKLRIRSLGQPAVVVIVLDFALLYCEKMKNSEWPRFIYTKLIFVIVEDNYAERIYGRGSSLRGSRRS